MVNGQNENFIPQATLAHRLYRLRDWDWKRARFHQLTRAVRVTPEVKILYLMPFQSCTMDCVD